MKSSQRFSPLSKSRKLAPSLITQDSSSILDRSLSRFEPGSNESYLTSALLDETSVWQSESDLLDKYKKLKESHEIQLTEHRLKCATKQNRILNTICTRLRDQLNQLQQSSDRPLILSLQLQPQLHCEKLKQQLKSINSKLQALGNSFKSLNQRQDPQSFFARKAQSLKAAIGQAQHQQRILLLELQQSQQQYIQYQEMLKTKQEKIIFLQKLRKQKQQNVSRRKLAERRVKIGRQDLARLKDEQRQIQQKLRRLSSKG